MVTDYVYKYLADEVYKIEDDKQNYKVDKEIFDRGDNGVVKNNKFKILALEDNQENGMQAMAVAPINSAGEINLIINTRNELKALFFLSRNMI